MFRIKLFESYTLTGISKTICFDGRIYLNDSFWIGNPQKQRGLTIIKRVGKLIKLTNVFLFNKNERERERERERDVIKLKISSAYTSLYGLQKR